jgi:hypothetical protein
MWKAAGADPARRPIHWRNQDAARPSRKEGELPRVYCRSPELARQSKAKPWAVSSMVLATGQSQAASKAGDGLMARLPSEDLRALTRLRGAIRGDTRADDTRHRAVARLPRAPAHRAAVGSWGRQGLDWKLTKKAWATTVTITSVRPFGALRFQNFDRVLVGAAGARRHGAGAARSLTAPVRAGTRSAPTGRRPSCGSRGTRSSSTSLRRQ